MYPHSDRLEFYQIIENECELLKELLIEARFRQWNGLIPLRDILSTYAVSTTHPLTCTVDTAVPETPLVSAQPLGRIVMGLIEQAERLTPAGSALTLHVALQDTETLRFSFSYPDSSATREFVARLNEMHEEQWSGQLRVSYDTSKIPYGIPWRYIKAEGGRFWYQLGEGPILVTCFTFPLSDPLAAP